ncbi:hypothetical protein QP157_16035 [Sphingomonas sp. LR61]
MAALDRIGERRRRRHQHTAGLLVVLGLADEVGGDEPGVGGLVGDHEDLGRAGLGVDADDTAHQALRRGHVVVARTGDQVDGLEVDRGDAVRQRADRAGAAHRVDLVDAEQSGRGQDRRVDRTAVVALRRGHECDRPDPGDLRGHDVHDDARRVDGLAAGHVEADAAHRLPALVHLGAVGERGDGAGRHLCGAGGSDAADGFVERFPQFGGQPGDGCRDLGDRHPDVRRGAAVEAFGLVVQCVRSAVSDVLDQLTGGVDRVRDVTHGARHESEEFGTGGQAATEVDSLHHQGTSLPR